jgi:hypothetical protein
MKLSDLVSVLRSKNAGPFLTTLDLLFKDQESYEALKASGLLSEERIVRAYGISPEEMVGIYFVDAIRAVKITMRKPAGKASGDLECTDVFGAQQHIPISNLDLQGIRH